jgi:hypothetical protein
VAGPVLLDRLNLVELVFAETVRGSPLTLKVTARAVAITTTVTLA